MAVLAPLNAQHHYSASDDWYRPYKYSGGLATPISSTSYTSAKSFSRFPAVNKDLRTEQNGRDDPQTTNMPPVHSPRHIASVLPAVTTTARPNLPSIRSLLAEPLASPPRTPVVPRATQQFSPRVPNYDDEHVHKRARPNYAWDGKPAHTPSASVHSLTSAYSDARRDSATQATLEPTAARVAKDGRSHQRLSSAFLPALKTTVSVPAFRAASPIRSAPVEGLGISRKRSFDSYSAPGTHERQAYLPPLGAATPRAQIVPQNELRTPLSQPHSAYPYHAPGHRNGEVVAVPRYSASAFHAVGEPSHTLGGAGSRPVYDYSLTKSRKRSNLPKESTDIMKRWFEEHLDNPYPSEEEKKFFATKAGINTTQVSNWFINHRRRCPELKEQRDKRPQANRSMIITTGP